MSDFTAPPSDFHVDAYPHRISLRPGDPLLFHIATDQPYFKVEIYRQGNTLDLFYQSDWFPGESAPPGSGSEDWQWPLYDLLPDGIPEHWWSGAYIAMFITGELDAGNTIVENSRPDTDTADGRTAKALFVVRSGAPGADTRLLYKLSLNTFHAYNTTGGVSLYVNRQWNDDPPGYKVSLLRPGGGTGGSVYIDPDPFDLATPRCTFAHWDPAFIVWLENNGYTVDYCTDLDLHEDPDLLADYNLLLSTGHDEYWSQAMRDHAAGFVQEGGNLAFFSGNVCYWRIHYVDDDGDGEADAFVCDKGAENLMGPDCWSLPAPEGPGDPENRLTGVSTHGGGLWAEGEPEPVGYSVQYAQTWFYEGTGLSDFDVFGAEEHLVSYECDGARLMPDPESPGFYLPSGEDGTSTGFGVLGIGWLQTPARDGQPGWMFVPAEDSAHAATMGLYVDPTALGTVFTAATTDWTRVLAAGHPVVDRITRNVLDRLSERGVG